MSITSFFSYVSSAQDPNVFHYIPCLSVAAGFLKIGIISSLKLGPVEKLDTLNASDIAEIKTACREFVNLSKISTYPMAVDIALYFLATQVLAVSLPIISSVLAVACALSITGRLLVSFYCLSKVIPRRSYLQT